MGCGSSKPKDASGGKNNDANVKGSDSKKKEDLPSEKTRDKTNAKDDSAKPTNVAQSKKCALLVIDVQNDFCKGGSLAVPGGISIIPRINALKKSKMWDAVLLTQDWHPKDHSSFASNNLGSVLFQEFKLSTGKMQMMWPDHCVQGSKGAEFHPDLDVTEADIVVRKGMNTMEDSYSGFMDDGGNHTEMKARLDALGITDVYCCGLATDYCVNFSVLDAVKLGYSTHAIEDCCRGIDVGGCAAAVADWKAKGVEVTQSNVLLGEEVVATKKEGQENGLAKEEKAVVKKALLVIDVQNDFCDGGSLEVKDGRSIIPTINALKKLSDWDAIILTQDWHPKDHSSFASNNPGSELFKEFKLSTGKMQMMWPDHCVQESKGAEFHPDLERAETDIVVRKGMNTMEDSYSGFMDDGGNHTEMKARLDALGITDVYCCGLATDYCVNFSVLDAVKLGFDTHAIEDCCRGIDAGGCAAAVANWKAKGVEVLQSNALLGEEVVATKKEERENGRAKEGKAVVKKALLVIDVQNDFCDGGSLEVKDGVSIIPTVNALKKLQGWDAVVLTQDWHPRGHSSFASNNPGSELFKEFKLSTGKMQMMWPDHCVQESKGAEFHPDLERADTDIVVRKGMNTMEDSYSGFMDDGGNHTEMMSRLDALGITDVYCCGLATDYCVNFSVLDAVKLGYTTHAIEDCCRGIDAAGCAAAVADWKAKGYRLSKAVPC